MTKKKLSPRHYERRRAAEVKRILYRYYEYDLSVRAIMDMIRGNPVIQSATSNVEVASLIAGHLEDDK